MSESLLDFYRRHQISPVRQDIRDLDAHFGRRAALYRHLGILPGFIRGQTVLEVGPGSGFNSLYTASLAPSRYVLLEGNPRGVDDIRELFSGYPSLVMCVELVCAPIEEFHSSEPFDFVLCEGMLALAGVPDPTVLLHAVARHTAPGGVLVITCIDAVSDFAEVLRRFVAQWLIDPNAELSQQVAQLLPVFSPHLSTLRGMTRRHDDWIVDNLLNPASIGPLLSIADAITALDGEFDVFGSSPMFLADWRWYKAIGGPSDGFNALGIDAYWSNVHNLLDHRSVSPARDPAGNRRLYAACVAVRDAVRQFERDRRRDVLAVVLDGLQHVADEVQTFSPNVGLAIRELHGTLNRRGFDGAAIAGCPRFAEWFGRGQQYLSLSRRSSKLGERSDDRRG